MSEPVEILIPAATVEELAQAVRDHIGTCSTDHRANFEQTPLVVFNWSLSTLTCRFCLHSEYLNKPPVDGGTLDTYVHHLLKQQQDFYERHFASCVAPHGAIA